MNCPRCASANEADAAFCDQCGAGLAEPAAPAAEPAAEPAAADGPEPCPACGGRVAAQGEDGVCESCGLELRAVSVPDRPGLARSLTLAIVRRVNEGRSIESAVEESVRELLPEDSGGCRAPMAAAEPEYEAAPPPALEKAARPPAAGPRSCPVCSGALAAGASRCGGCGLSLASSGPVTCPSCGEEADASDGECECGAILTFACLAERMDDTVQLVCGRCKQLYAASRPDCADCGGRLLSASPLRRAVEADAR